MKYCFCSDHRLFRTTRVLVSADPAFGVNDMANRLVYLIACCLLLCSINATAQSQSPRRGTLTAAADNSPEAELATFDVADGYAVNLFADETDGIANPIAIHWDWHGRLWVLCTKVYPQLEPGDQPNDRLVILQDTDGDGRADNSKVFAEGLNMPTGFAIGDGGVYVSEGADLIHLTDLDGDDRSDQRRLVFSGFGTDDAHQKINSFTWTPGGDLMFCQGMHTFSRVETPWGIARGDGAGVWRFRTRQLLLEPFLMGVMASDNPWGICFGRWGEPWLKGNDYQLFFMTPGMVPTHNYIRIADSYGLVTRLPAKSMALDIIESQHMPDDVQGCVLIAGYYDQSVRRVMPRDDGAGIVGTQLPKLLQGEHPAFRPVEIRVGPDGAIYVADFFNPIISHYQAAVRHPSRDKTHGRVWRITARGRPLSEIPRLADLALLDLLNQLKHSERWLRHQAKRRLAEMPTAKVIPAARRWLQTLDVNTADYEHACFELLGVFQSHDVVEMALIEQLLDADDPRARAYATHAIGRWQHRMDDPLRLLRESVVDDHPRVRLEAIVATAFVPSHLSVEVATLALGKPMDPYLQHSLVQAVHALADYWKPSFDRGELLFGGDSSRVAFVLDALGSKETAKDIRRLLETTSAGEDTRGRLLLQLVSSGSEQDLSYALVHSGNHAEVLKELFVIAKTKRLKPVGDLARDLAPHLASSKPAVRADAFRLVGAWRLMKYAAKIRGVAEDTTEPSEVRAAAIEALVELEELNVKRLLRKLVADSNLRVRHSAAAGLCRVDVADGANTVAALLADASDEQTVSQLLQPLFEVREGTIRLAEQLNSHAVSADVAKLATRVMNAAGRDDTKLQEKLAQLAGTDSGLIAYSSDYVQDLIVESNEHGDVVRGRAVHSSKAANCIACHRVDGTGGISGPDLSSVARGMPPELIVESVIWPKRQIKSGYLATKILTEDGQIVQGYKVSSGEAEVAIKDPATGRLTRLSSDSIEEISEAGTLMPEGLTRTMTRQELLDLMKFLFSLKGVGLAQ